MEKEFKPNFSELMFLELMGITLQDGRLVDESGNWLVLEDQKEILEKFDNDKYKYTFRCGNKTIVFYRDKDRKNGRRLSNKIIIKEGNVEKEFEECEDEKDYPTRKFDYRRDGKSVFEVSTRFNVTGGVLYVVGVPSHYSNINCFVNKIQHFRASEDDKKERSYWYNNLSGMYLEHAYFNEIRKDLCNEDSKVKEFATQIFPYIYEGYKKALAIPVVFEDNLRLYYEKEKNRINNHFTNAVAMALTEKNEDLEKVGEDEEAFEKYVEMNKDKEEARRHNR